ncbi:protein kinase [Streptomyces sp. AC512_CC834]|uniref:serine/threonine-protein kinase n=1 Tax=Streptomyces sp. AC512_CC834 TaxID=2823691 RepID=UPI0027E47AC1|nr:protein kinase [Streptomyces sp. AC512_CC834]
MTGNRAEEIAGRYLLLERLGSGGMGTVWRATDRLLERTVAVKDVHLHGGGEDLSQRLRRAHREARAIARISHPNVINIHDLVDYEDRLWLVMELVEGPSLAEHVAAHGPPSVQRVAEIGLELLGALNAVHSVGALHRDVKPGNVLLRADGRVVLCDFGIVELTDTESLTTSGGVIGTVEYLSPERMKGLRAGPPSDLFSLGSTLCALFTGGSPFARPEPAAAAYALVNEPPLLPEAAGPLRPLLAALLHKDPAARPSPDEIANALRAVAATPGSAVQPGRPTTAAEVLSPPNDRRRRLLRVGRWSALLAAVLLTGGAVTTLLANRSSGQPGTGADGTPGAESSQSASIQPTSTRIGAALPAPGDPYKAWLFSGDQYLLVSLSRDGEPVESREEGPAPLTDWTGAFEDLPGFRDGIDAVLPVLRGPNEYWVFSGPEYIRMRVSDNNDNGDGYDDDYSVTRLTEPAPLEHWREAFCTEDDFVAGIDAVMTVPGDPAQAWIFAGNSYVRTTLNGTGAGGTCAIDRTPLSNWSGTFKNYDNFKREIDAVLPVPDSESDYWVFSGDKYLRIRLDSEDYSDTSNGTAKPLPDWRTFS